MFLNKKLTLNTFYSRFDALVDGFGQLIKREGSADTALDIFNEIRYLTIFYMQMPSH